MTVTLPRDTRPPSAPVLSVTEVGPTHATLAWASTDDSPSVFYTWGTNTITVVAIDAAGNRSAAATLVVTL